MPKAIDHRWILVTRRLSAKLLEPFLVLRISYHLFQFKAYFGDPLTYQNSKFPYPLRILLPPFGKSLPVKPSIGSSPRGFYDIMLHIPTRV